MTVLIFIYNNLHDNGLIFTWHIINTCSLLHDVQKQKKTECKIHDLECLTWFVQDNYSTRKPLLEFCLPGKKKWGILVMWLGLGLDKLVHMYAADVMNLKYSVTNGFTVQAPFS